MKKIAPIFAVALLGMMFTSCKKDFTCTCKDKNGAVAGSYTYPKTKKSAAKTACDGWNTSFSAAGGSCSLN